MCWYDGQEPKTLVCLTNLRTEMPPMLPKLNRKRALFVLTKIDEILAWERRSEAERTRGSSSWGGIYAKCGQASTGG